MDRESELIWEAYNFNPRDSDLDIAIDILRQIFLQEGDVNDKYIEASKALEGSEMETITHAVKIVNQEYNLDIDGSHILELMAGDPGAPGDEYGWDDYE